VSLHSREEKGNIPHPNSLERIKKEKVSLIYRNRRIEDVRPATNKSLAQTTQKVLP
jgi:hypothetical protein